MITISTLQSQIALNRNILRFLELCNKCTNKNIEDVKTNVKLYPHITGTSSVELEVLYFEIKMRKKQIKQYAKLQRALKSELAYRIMYNRGLREINMDNYQLK